MEDIKKAARKFSLQNAIFHEGKAQPGAVIGKVMGTFPEARSRSKEIVPIVGKIVNEVNSLGFEEQKARLEALDPDMLEKKTGQRNRTLPDIPVERGDVVFRFEPSPSGPLHIGHAYVFLLNFGLSQKYDGRLVLRIADTNPDNIYPPAYDMIPEDAAWLTNGNVTKASIQSDRLERYHLKGRDVIEKGLAYVCTCNPEEASQNIREHSRACPCRSLSIPDNLERWEKMFDTFAPGEAIVRVKTDINHPNPALRDWGAFRIIDSSHPRVGDRTRVWPLMTFSVGVDDHMDGITHSVRAKEHRNSQMRLQFLYDAMGWTMPHHMYVGRMNFKDLAVSCSKTRPRIEAGEFTGWDDVRLPFLTALKKRGYQPGAFQSYAVEVGMTETDKTVTGDDYFKQLGHFNREIVDPLARRYFFVKEPLELSIFDVDDLKGSAPLHPQDPDQGTRDFHLTGDIKVLLDTEDRDEVMQGTILRLKDLCNVEVTSPGVARFLSTDPEEFKGKARIVHWVPSDENVPARVLMPDGKWREGSAEVGLKDASGVVQLERFGFCNVTWQDDGIVGYFTHK